jgi:SAM-dependent methyltransferase
MDFLLSNPANSRLHSLNFLKIIYEYPEMLESIDSVLDVGSRDGHDAHWWAECDDGDESNPLPLNINVTALDNNPNWNKDFEHSNINKVKADWDTITFDKKFDVVWAHSVLQEANNPLKFLHKMNEFTSDGGVMCLSFPTTINTFYGEPDHRIYETAKHQITIPSLIYMLALSGFNSRDGFIYKQPNTNVINAFVYKDSAEVFDYNEKSIHELLDFMPEVCTQQIEKFGYITNKGLILKWLTGTIVDYSNV